MAAHFHGAQPEAIAQISGTLEVGLTQPLILGMDRQEAVNLKKQAEIALFEVGLLCNYLPTPNSS